MTVQISAEEFGSRRAEAARRAAERGLSGLVVFSRGGTTLDYYGDVMYLANFHSTFPPISDAPTWAGRGHAALVLPVDGPSVLITDYLNDSDDRAEVDDVRVELRVPKAIGRVLRELELDGSALTGRRRVDNAALVRPAPGGSWAGARHHSGGRHPLRLEAHQERDRAGAHA